MQFRLEAGSGRRSQVDRKRICIAAIIAVVVMGGLSGSRVSGQNPPDAMPGERRETAKEAPLNPEAEKHILEENEKDVKKKVERLYELATELKAGADKTDSSKVLNLTLLKKVEEIEKLAHDIKARSKG